MEQNLTRIPGQSGQARLLWLCLDLTDLSPLAPPGSPGIFHTPSKPGSQLGDVNSHLWICNWEYSFFPMVCTNAIKMCF